MKVKDKKVSKNVKAALPIVLTLEEEEEASRIKRAQQEKMHVEPLQKAPHPFVTYRVKSQTNLKYTVEIRSLTEKINSCSCPDFHVNTIGTCKHIEGVLSHINKGPAGKQPQSPFIEIFLRSSEKKSMSVSWPMGRMVSPEIKKMIAPYFSSNCTAVASPIYGLSSIEHALSQAPAEMREKIRISSHLQNWVADLQVKESNRQFREQFLEDVKCGKCSTQVVSASLYPYQEEGMMHLAFQGKALLADEMGLGKTIQAIAACELLRRHRNIRRVLVVSPASLKGEWEEQIAKFTGLPTAIVAGNRSDRLKTYKEDTFFFLTNYEQIRSDFEEIQRIVAPDVLILDEAQRVKNWQTKTAWAVKQLKMPYAFVLTGTPIENRIDELYSIMQVIDPTLLGPLFKFNQEYFKYNEKGKPAGFKNLEELHRKLKPVLLRRLKKDVEDELPDRTVNNFFVKMDDEQSLRYDEYNAKVAKLYHIMKNRPLTKEEGERLQRYLACMRMICDTPYILDENCRICPKLEELKQILPEIMEGNQNKIIIFSEWERMLTLVREFVEEELQEDFAWHTGAVPQKKRLEDIKRFKTDPSCRFFLTTDSGSTGLNLQCANVVINLDLPWNPAKLEQRIARAWRKNQTKAVQVINLVCEESIEHRMLSTLARKQALASGVLDGTGDLNAIAMPSARMEILKQLEGLFSEQNNQAAAQTVPAAAKADPVEGFKNDVIAHFNDRIHMMKVHKSPQSSIKTIVAIVDKMDEVIAPKIRNFIPSQEEECLNLELMDQQTYALLQRLEAAGMITINTQAGESLYHSPNALRSKETEREQRIKEANKLLADAERKLKMMNLLASGGFSIEALKPAEEALKLGLKLHTVLKRGSDAEGEKLLERTEACISKEDEKLAKTIIEEVDQCLKRYSEQVALCQLGR